MITARNYAAQAERGLLKTKQYLLRKGFGGDASYVQSISEKISKAEHFAIPDNGKIFGDGYKGLVGCTIRLPFPSITIECFFENNAVVLDEKRKVFSAPRKIVILAEEVEVSNDVYEVTVHEIHYLEAPDLWSVGILNARFSGLFEDANILYGYNTPQMTRHDIESGIIVNDDLPMLKNGIVVAGIRPMLELIEALTCKNISTEPLERIDQLKNARRIKDGKLPLYETKILTVDTSYGNGGKHTGITYDDRASVRQHLRRGHIRRHPTAGNIWVNACVVGHSELGVIDKQYAVM